VKVEIKLNLFGFLKDVLIIFFELKEFGLMTSIFLIKIKRLIGKKLLLYLKIKLPLFPLVFLSVFLILL